MDVCDFLYGVGAELQGLNRDPEAREAVVRYAKERLQEALARIEKEEEDGSDESR